MNSSLLQTALALALVVGLVLALAWAVQRLGGLRARRDLQMVSQLNLGQRERLVVVAWDGQEWMLGVGPGRVNLIAHRDAVLAEASHGRLDSQEPEAGLPAPTSQPQADLSDKTPAARAPRLHAVGGQPPQGLSGFAAAAGPAQDLRPQDTAVHPPGRAAAPAERPTLPQAFALQLQQTLARWSQR